MNSEPLPRLKQQLADAVRNEAEAVQVAVALADAEAPVEDVDAALRRVDSIRLEPARLADAIRALEAQG